MGGGGGRCGEEERGKRLINCLLQGVSANVPVPQAYQ